MSIISNKNSALHFNWLKFMQNSWKIYSKLNYIERLIRNNSLSEIQWLVSLKCSANSKNHTICMVVCIQPFIRNGKQMFFHSNYIKKKINAKICSNLFYFLLFCINFFHFEELEMQNTRFWIIKRWFNDKGGDFELLWQSLLGKLFKNFVGFVDTFVNSCVTVVYINSQPFF